MLPRPVPQRAARALQAQGWLRATPRVWLPSRVYAPEAMAQPSASRKGSRADGAACAVVEGEEAEEEIEETL